MRIEYFGYWYPGAKAPGHQYPQSWYNIHCIGTALYQIIISIVNNMQTYDYYYCAVLWCANKLSTLCPDGRIHLFAHFTTQLSSLCRLSECIELLNCFSDTSCLECGSNIRSIFSIIFYATYGAVCILCMHYFYDDCENTCTLSCYHNQIESKTHLSLFRVRLWNNCMHWMSFTILITFWKKIVWGIISRKVTLWMVNFADET